jgi:hypothetical protein
MHPSFILLALSLLGSCGASNDSIFNLIYSSFQNRDKKGIASVIDYNEIRKCYWKTPCKTLKAILDINNREISYFVLKILKSVCDSEYQKFIRPADQNKIISKIFKALNRLITNSIIYSRVNFGQQKRLFELIISLMKRTDYSDTIINIKPLLIKKFSITTKQLVDAFSRFVLTLEEETPGEFEKAYYQLIRLSKRPKGDIPEEHGVKTRIYSLIFTCAYHSHVDRITVDPERSNPLMMAFLLRFRSGNDVPAILFSECASESMRSKILQQIRKYPEIKKVFYKYGFEGHSHPKSLVPRIIEELGELSWHFLIYLRLLPKGNPPVRDYQIWPVSIPRPRIPRRRQKRIHNIWWLNDRIF